MSVVSVRRVAESRNLALAGFVIDALGITETADIEQVDRLVAAASRSIETAANRIFARELVTERFGVEDLDVGSLGGSVRAPHRIMLTRLPVLMIEAVRFNGADIDLTEIQLEDSDAGFLFRRGGFASTAIFHQQIEPVRTRFKDLLWEVDYSGGFVLPSYKEVDETFGIGDVDIATNKITLAGHILANGDTVKLSSDGVLPAPLSVNRDYIVRATGSADFELADAFNGASIDITDVGSGTHKIKRVVTLPEDLQNAVIKLVVSEFHRRGADRSITQERLGDYAVTYGDMSMPADIAAVVERYADFV